MVGVRKSRKHEPRRGLGAGLESSLTPKEIARELGPRRPGRSDPCHEKSSSESMSPGSVQRAARHRDTTVSALPDTNGTNVHWASVARSSQYIKGQKDDCFVVPGARNVWNP